MITKEDIPDGWHPGMTEKELRDSLLKLIRANENMHFVRLYLSESGDSAIELLVDAACSMSELEPNRVKFINTIKTIEGSVTKKQLFRLTNHPACKNSAVRAAVKRLLMSRGLHGGPCTPQLAETQMGLFEFQKPKRRRKRKFPF